MTYLIVNGDDFGASPGITRGIIDAHHLGILTSTSFMLDMPASQDAVAESRQWPHLSIGLHAAFTDEEAQPVVDFDDVRACRAHLYRQFGGFIELMGRLPTHLDSHHNVHRDPRLLPHFLELSAQYALPLRGHSQARYFSSFYGQWHGETHLEQLSVDSLLRMLAAELREGITELSCHPGYVDESFTSSYSVEREAELHTLCDPAIRRFLQDASIHLIGFRDLANVLAGNTQ
jgi:chitin disaccharide deacetylase